MKYRRFGRTDLQMPVISCGGMRYQYKWKDVAPKEIPRENQENLEATIHRAVELGINHIETARGYGSSEMQLGNVLPKLPREKIIVQTKIAPKATPEEFVETFETSMSYLKLDHVDLLSLRASVIFCLLVKRRRTLKPNKNATSFGKHWCEPVEETGQRFDSCPHSLRYRAGVS